MTKQADGPTYQTLQEQYQHLGLPVELIDGHTDFTIFNLADLRQPLPFKSPVSRLIFFVFGFIKDARGRYFIDEQQFRMQPGTVYFTNPGHYRSFEYEAIGEAYLITFSEDFLKQHVHADIFEEFPFLLAETFPARTVAPALFAEFERLYAQIHREHQAHSPFRQRLIGHLLVVLLLKLKEYLWLDYNPIYEGNRSSQIVRRFKQMMDTHYRDLSRGSAEQVFRVPEYAAAQHLHPNYLNMVIKAKTGKTIGAWLAEKTMAEAKSLLQNTSLSIKEIAYRLGFAVPVHFSNYFKKHTQRPPGQYRRGNQAAESEGFVSLGG